MNRGDLWPKIYGCRALGCAPSEAPLEESRNVVVVMIALIAPRSGSWWNPGGRLIGSALIQVGLRDVWVTWNWPSRIDQSIYLYL